MTVYMYIIKNRIREYKRLIRNMRMQIIALLIILMMFIRGIWVWYMPVLREMEAFNPKVFKVIMLVIFLINLKKIIGGIRPYILVKPMTLYLFDGDRVNKLFCIKYIYFGLKYFLISLLFAVCTCGFIFDRSFFQTLSVYFICLLTGLLSSWNIYNSLCKRSVFFYRVLVILLSVLSLFGKKYIVIVGVEYLILVAIWIYTVKKLQLNYFKYAEDMTYMEKVLAAQNNNNAILLSQFAKEKIARKVENTKGNSVILNKYPLVWKAFTSISRIGKLAMLIGIAVFIVTFTIYITPALWSLPVIEVEGMRHVLLLFGIFLFYQTSVQMFTRQLEDIMDKQKEGLYIPIGINEIIIQFSFIPVIILSFSTVLLAILLKSQIYMSIIFFTIVLIHLGITMFMTVRNRSLLKKIYVLLSLIFLAASNLLIL